MCLYVSSAKFEVKVATEDLKCYKIMDKIDENHFESMYKKYRYSKGLTNNQSEQFSNAIDETLKKGTAVKIDRDGFVYHVYTKDMIGSFIANHEEVYCFTDGGFHSFTDLSAEDVYGMGFVGVECVIPKGSRYVVGYDYVEKKQAYFSESIRVVGEKRFA